MPYLTTNYQIAAGYNNAGSLALVTTLVDGNGIYFVEPVEGLNNQSRGLPVTRANKTVVYQGSGSVTWLSPVLLAQYEYLKDNYEGLVTIKVAFHSETFANYNAVLTLPSFSDLEMTMFDGRLGDPDFTGPGYWLNWLFTGLEAL